MIEKLGEGVSFETPLTIARNLSFKVQWDSTMGLVKIMGTETMIKMKVYFDGRRAKNERERENEYAR